MTREEQKQQRRMLILMKALELFVKKGYTETKISDIAAAADMSAGLMFHYFESKEQLYEELVRMGAEGANFPMAMNYDNPLQFFEGFLHSLFDYARQQPWVFYMFVLMAQARRSDSTPPRVKQLAMSVNQVTLSARIIAMGQKTGHIRPGDPEALSLAFWSSVQGVMEQIAAQPELLADGGEKLPDPAWLVDIIRNKGEE